MDSSGDAAENDSLSSTSGSQASNEVTVTEDSNYSLEPDSNFDDAINKLDELKLEPDSDLPEVASEDSDQDKVSVGDDAIDDKQISEKDKNSSKKVTINSDKKDDSKKNTKVTKKPSLFDRLKSLTKFEKPPKNARKTNYSKFTGIKVDRLPVCFVAKYIGHKEAKGLFGLEHVREPVDELIAKVKDDLVSMDRVELPLCYMVFSSRGIDIRNHPSNKVEGGLPLGLHPIDFISYGVQDMRYWRVFTFIAVNELGMRKKKSECHAFIADSSQSARKMALALGACFSVYKKKLTAEGKFHNFQVELRPPDELAGELNNDVEA